MLQITVTDSSHVAEARRRVGALAGGMGFDETSAGRVAIAVTELATNLVRHGGGGTMLVQRDRSDPDRTAGLELLALDKGPGMTSVEECLRDGFSTRGTPGNGLGAVRRQSAGMAIYSRPGLGTAVLCRFRAAAGPRALATPDQPASCPVVIGGLAVPIPGDEACGDAWHASLDDGGGATLLLADGLGHGPAAATAAQEAVRLFSRTTARPVDEILSAVHEGLRATRGAAVSIARYRADGTVAFGGIGNVAGAIVGPDGALRRMVSLTGTAGVVARRIQVFDYKVEGPPLLVLHTDGLASGWSLDRYPGLAVQDPVLIAGVLFRDFSRGRDDVGIVVLRSGVQRAGVA